ncbi:chromosome partitioning protein [Terrabacter tumescens]|uniref:non-specific protein-tyrosine kinase n=1 Tax=Terrabacter tumescens TaxID=60443 RepID=A0ABQ2IF63_9MICO|nr:polysaccharide biosynthesis tyrosine autokinase [Terrabacter tumescens]GGN09254.1 chromosome partitioning protein [Terrabacter tumescens]
MTFREFLGVLGARWRIIAVTLLAVVAAVAVQTMLTPAVYASSSKIYLRATQPASSSTNNQVATYAVSASDLATYLEVLTSPSVMDPLRTRLGLPANYPLSVSGEVSQTSNMMTITAIGGDAQLVARVAAEVGPVLADVATKKFSPLLAANGQSVEATTITPAEVPGAPTSPNAKRNLALGGLLGLALGIGLALLRHTLDTKVRTKEDIAALSSRPILGDLPMVKSVKGGLLSLESDPHGRHAEAIRRLRTNILFVDVTTGGHSFVVTSSVPGEGKTTTTINLALAMADAGSKVLLIDGDLRNPSVASTMGLDGSFGLTTLLLGQADPDDVVQRWRETTLHVLPAGPVPPNPSELLGSEPMEALFGKLSHEYDFILVDSPPVVPVIDAVLINKLTHGLIMVVGAERTKKRDLASAVQSLETVDAPVAGFALNMVSAGSSTAHRYGYYGYNRDSGVKLSRREQREREGRHA